MTLPKEVRINHVINQTIQLVGYVKQSFKPNEAIVQLQNSVTRLQEAIKTLQDSQLK